MSLFIVQEGCTVKKGCVVWRGWRRLVPSLGRKNFLEVASLLSMKVRDQKSRVRKINS
jgi:hypothetical protein